MSAAPSPIALRTIGRFLRSVTTATVAVFLVALVLVAIPGPRAANAGGTTWFAVDVDNARIRGDGWMPGSTVTITIDFPDSGVPSYVRAFVLGINPSFNVYIGNEYHPKANDMVTVKDSSGDVKTHVVTSPWLTESDEAADTVSGVATPGATVGSWVDATFQSRATQADSGGRWTVDYTPWNLMPGTAMTFRVFDDDGDATEIHVTLPVDADIDHDGVRNTVDNCPFTANTTQYDGDGDGIGTRCDDVDRVWGANRYGTSANVAEMAFEEADTVLIALGTNFPDALVAAAAGGSEDAPVLLTAAGSLPAETIAEINRLNPTTAYIVGGTAAIKPAVEAQLHTLVPSVIRLWGGNRYETSAAVSSTFFSSPTDVFVASGENFPDALVAAAAAGFYSAPVLLTQRDHTPQATRSELARINPVRIFIVGGTAVISEVVEQDLTSYAGTVTRLAGPDRYATAAAVSNYVFGMTRDKAFLAYGGDFPDALVAAAAGGHLGAPVLLVTHDSIPAVTYTELTRSGSLRRDHTWLVGGTAVIGDPVASALP